MPDPTIEAREKILALIWLYCDWQYVTKNLTTPERELWADAIDNVHRREEPLDFMPVSRWWRTDWIEPAEPPPVEDPAAGWYCGAHRWHGRPSFVGPHPPHTFTYGSTGQYTGTCSGRT